MRGSLECSNQHFGRDRRTGEILVGLIAGIARHRRQLSQREREIMRSVVEAERSNDAAGVLRLKQEKLELNRKVEP